MAAAVTGTTPPRRSWPRRRSPPPPIPRAIPSSSRASTPGRRNRRCGTPIASATAPAPPPLFAAHAGMGGLAPAPLTAAKQRELLEVIRSCAGLWIEALAARPTVTPGARLRVTLSIVNRSDAPLTLERIELPFGATARLAATSRADSAAHREVAKLPLAANEPFTAQTEIALPADLPITQPYWLRVPALKGSYQVADQGLIGSPDNPPALTARVVVSGFGERIELVTPIVYRWLDPALGDRYRPLEIAP